MSEKVSLDFLISLKQANTNIEQTRKVGGIMDYLTTMARRANDAMFSTSRGEDVSQKLTDKAGDVSKAGVIQAAASALAGRAVQKFMGSAINLTRASLGIWVEHAGAMIKFRKELGYSSAATHQFSLGVSRAAMMYGTSMRSVRDIAFFMAQGAKNGSAEIGKLAGQLALLSEYGGIGTGTLTSFVDTMVFMGNMTDEQAAHMSLALKAVAVDANVSAENTVKAWSEVGELLPHITDDYEDFQHMMTGLMVETQRQRQDAGALAGYLSQAMSNESTKLYSVLKSNGGNFRATTTQMYDQLKILYAGVEQGDKSAIHNFTKMSEAWGMSNFKVAKQFMEAMEANAKNGNAKIEETFNQSTESLKAKLKSDLTAMEEVREMAMKVKAAAGNFWEGWLGGEGGKFLVSYLKDVLSFTMQALEDLNYLTGKREKTVKASQGLAETTGEAVARRGIYGQIMGGNDQIALGGMNKQERAEYDRRLRKDANDMQAWRTGAMEGPTLNKFVPPEWALTKDDIPRLQKQLEQSQGAANSQRIEQLLSALVEKTKEGNEERVKQRIKQGKKLGQAAAASLAQTGVQ